MPNTNSRGREGPKITLSEELLLDCISFDAILAQVLLKAHLPRFLND